MADFDWVTARAECSLVALFERLKLQLQEDIAKRQSLRGAGPDFYYGFKLVVNGKGAAVVLEGVHELYDSVLFRLTDAAIEIVDKNNKVVFKATPTLSDDGECRLNINGQERELWHLRKLALEGLFFSEPTAKLDPFAQFGGKRAAR